MDFNPNTSRLNYLTQQKMLIENEIRSLQPVQQSYDKHIVWVDSEAQAKTIVKDDVVAFEKQVDCFYMNVNGVIKKFSYQEVPIIDEQTRLDKLEKMMTEMYSTILGGNHESISNN